MKVRFLALFLLTLLISSLTACSSQSENKQFPPPTVTITVTSQSTASDIPLTITAPPITTTLPPVTITSPPITITVLPASFIPITFMGIGNTTTAPFSVTTDEWIIDWSYTTYSDFPFLSFFIYPRGKTSGYVKHISTDDIVSGTSYCYAGKGEFYIEILAANLQSWKITIRPPY